MPLKSPNLDDRSFAQLLADALHIVQQKNIGWTDLSPSDPGMVLLELFTYLTETMLYRLNRLPEKAYVEFLRLLGVKIHPPSAATVELTFTRPRSSNQPLLIPRGTRVTVGRTSGGQEPPIFTTATSVEISAGETEATVRAYHCEQVEGELVGKGTGFGGQMVQVRRPPIIAHTGDALDLVVGVEVMTTELDERVPAVHYQGKVYRIWREVEHFTDSGEDAHLFVADRQSGWVIFAPAVQMTNDEGELPAQSALLAEVPAANREIRIWYRRGGGVEGNVAEGKLTQLKDPIPGITVTNKSRATGGKAAESLENALLRGPQELHSLRRAVTARDFELIALNHSGRAVARAKAFTRSSLWKHAAPGHVELLLVPDIPEADRRQLTVQMLHAHHNQAILERIRQSVEERRPLGTACSVNWARYKQVKVKARIVIRRQEDRAALAERIRQRLYQTITPLRTQFNTTGWIFGEALRASHVYDIALDEPGVRWVDQVRLGVDEVPDRAIKALAIDFFQPKTWYVGNDNQLFRSLNDGEGWEKIGEMDAGIVAIATHPNRAGLVALATKNGSQSQIWISADCGETWSAGKYPLDFAVNGLAWTMRGNDPILFLATDAGLYELILGKTPVQVLVDPQTQNRGFYAVVTYLDGQGNVAVAAAAQNLGGVFLSLNGGRLNSFRRIQKNIPSTADIRVLAIQQESARAFLWAGAAAADGGEGTGCYRWELRGTQDPPEGWMPFGTDWKAGSCKGLAFHRGQVFAATHRLGVVRLDSNQPDARWQAPMINCGLPLREREAQRLFLPVEAVATSLYQADSVVMAGGDRGIYRSIDAGISYSPASAKEFIEKVTLPDSWLFVSGNHEVELVSEEEAE